MAWHGTSWHGMGTTLYMLKYGYLLHTEESVEGEVVERMMRASIRLRQGKEEQGTKYGVGMAIHVSIYLRATAAVGTSQTGIPTDY